MLWKMISGSGGPSKGMRLQPPEHGKTANIVRERDARCLQVSSKLPGEEMSVFCPLRFFSPMEVVRSLVCQWFIQFSF